MSSFRNIIARRRPTVEPDVKPVEAVDEDEALDPGQLADLIEEISPTSTDEPDHKPQDQPRATLDAPRWEVEPPRPTMGADLLKGDAQGPAPEPAPSPPARTRAGNATRRRIWDMDESLKPSDAEDGTALPSKDPLMLTPDMSEPEVSEAAAMAPAAPPAPAAPSPAPARGGRVKTRLLGFHSEDSTENLFAADRASAAPAGIQCPVGWLVIVEGPGRGSSFALSQGLSTLGRGTDQSVSLAFGDDAISRDNHASIAYDEEENTILIGHGGKSNLVRLNGKPLVSTTALANGDQIRLGKTTLRFVALCGPEFRWTSEDSGAASDG